MGMGSFTVDGVSWPGEAGLVGVLMADKGSSIELDGKGAGAGGSRGALVLATPAPGTTVLAIPAPYC